MMAINNRLSDKSEKKERKSDSEVRNIIAMNCGKNNKTTAKSLRAIHSVEGQIAFGRQILLCILQYNEYKTGIFLLTSLSYN